MKKFSKLLVSFLLGMMAFTVNATTIKDNPVPVHRPLIEEYTGTWCGWCVRGLVGMELLRQEFGDEFIGVAYHNGDAMEIMASNNFPSRVSGFPSAFIERTYQVDPYYGSGNTSAGIVNYMKQVATLAVNAGIEVSAEWTSEDKTDIDVHVTSYFTEDESNASYVIEVMLVADDLYGTGSGWNQTNYYNGYTAYASDPYLGPWVKKPYTITGYHFNDVIVGTSRSITGSLPKAIVAYELYDCDYTFTLANLPVPSLIQNKDNLRVVAIVYNTKTRKVINANRSYIDDFVVSIPGDSDNDGNVTIADVVLTIDYIMDNETPINLTNADVNGDGITTIADVTAIIDIILGN